MSIAQLQSQPCPLWWSSWPWLYPLKGILVSMEGYDVCLVVTLPMYLGVYGRLWCMYGCGTSWCQWKAMMYVWLWHFLVSVEGYGVCLVVAMKGYDVCMVVTMEGYDLCMVVTLPMYLGVNGRLWCMYGCGTSWCQWKAMMYVWLWYFLVSVEGYDVCIVVTMEGYDLCMVVALIGVSGRLWCMYGCDKGRLWCMYGCGNSCVSWCHWKAMIYVCLWHFILVSMEVYNVCMVVALTFSLLTNNSVFCLQQIHSCSINISPLFKTRGPWATMLTWVNSYKRLIQHFSFNIEMATYQNE